jgi:hypothetical protein
MDATYRDTSGVAIDDHAGMLACCEHSKGRARAVWAFGSEGGIRRSGPPVIGVLTGASSRGVDQDPLGSLGVGVLAGSFDESAVDEGGSGAGQGGDTPGHHMAAAHEPGPLVTLVRWRTAARDQSGHINSRFIPGTLRPDIAASGSHGEGRCGPLAIPCDPGSSGQEIPVHPMTA